MSVSISQPLEEKGFGRDEYDRQPKGRDNSIVKMPESIQTGSRNVRAVVHMDFNLLVSFAVLSHHTLYLCLKWQKKNNISSYIFYIKIKVKFKFYFCVSVPGTQHTPLHYHQTATLYQSVLDVHLAFIVSVTVKLTMLGNVFFLEN